MANPSSTLAWKVPCMEESSRLQSMEVAKSRTRLSDFTLIFFMCLNNTSPFQRIFGVWHQLPGFNIFSASPENFQAILSGRKYMICLIFCVCLFQSYWPFSILWMLSSKELSFDGAKQKQKQPPLPDYLKKKSTLIITKSWYLWIIMFIATRVRCWSLLR